MALLLAGALESGAAEPPDARRRARRVQQVYRKYLRGRLTAPDAAGRILDRAGDDAASEAVLRVILDLGSRPAGEQEKAISLLEEIDRLLVSRSRSRVAP